MQYAQRFEQIINTDSCKDIRPSDCFDKDDLRSKDDIQSCPLFQALKQ
jgi:hypothetical protein